MYGVPWLLLVLTMCNLLTVSCHFPELITKTSKRSSLVLTRPAGHLCLFEYSFPNSNWMLNLKSCQPYRVTSGRFRTANGPKITNLSLTLLQLLALYYAITMFAGNILKTGRTRTNDCFKYINTGTKHTNKKLLILKYQSTTL